MTDHLELLVDIGELQALLSGSEDFHTFLQNVVTLVAEYMDAAVVSIYLLHQTESELVLEATHGLAADAVGKVRLKLGEGLVGCALKELRVILEPEASSHPRFKHFPGINEDPYESFLAVPIRRGISRIGVLVAQREKTHPFSTTDSSALRAIASQLATAVENGRVLIDLQEKRRAPEKVFNRSELPPFFRGKGASDCSALAPVVTLKGGGECGLKPETMPLCSRDDFERAILSTEERIDELQDRLKDEMPEAASLIFTAHRMMLMDPEFLSGIRQRIDSGVNPPVAVEIVARSYIEMFKNSDHAYMREKAEDVADLSAQLVASLTGRPHRLCADCEERIVITRELFPSHMLQLFLESVKGIILGSGGVTGHVAILARALSIPLVICNDPLIFSVPDGMMVLLDGVSGCIHLDPEDTVIEPVMAVARQMHAVTACDSPLSAVTRTRDGTTVHLLANINLLCEVELACRIQAEGIGLYRSEFPFLIRNSFPSEAEQVDLYSRLFAAMSGRLVTVRTLDVGGEKALSYYDGSHEENPELGLRSTRFAMEHREVFSHQLRAILRAAEGHERLRIMFPMISSLDEFRAARAVVTSIMQDLSKEEIAFHQHPLVGMMVEVPSAVEMMPELGREADFFSIGTNDFVQYLLAVDRNNEKVASYYLPHHPAVLRSLSRAIGIAVELGKDVAVCGEMAHDPRFLRFFLGCGVRSLSADPHSLHLLQKEIGRIDLEEAGRHARHLLTIGCAEEIERLIALEEMKTGAGVPCLRPGP